MEIKKSIKVKNKLYCGNCGKSGHTFKYCNDPISSYGIILTKFDKEEYKNNIKSENIIDINNSNPGVSLENENDIKLFYLIRDHVHFLLIRRKHTLGYIEFMRGRYKIDNIDAIIHLFRQMTKEEINKIKTKKFDILWNNLWKNSNNKTNYDIEYRNSKKKFNTLKNDDTILLNLDFYISNVNPIWTHPEWGFPKGRRNFMETDYNCAIREFEEETGLISTDYTILNEFNSFTEELIGTNGIKYKHVYYIGTSISNKKLEINKKNLNQINEIGDIGWFTYDKLIKLLRPHHTERKSIITKIYLSIINNIMGNIKNK